MQGLSPEQERPSDCCKAKSGLPPCMFIMQVKSW
jgi:hypothetical protein